MKTLFAIVVSLTLSVSVAATETQNLPGGMFFTRKPDLFYYHFKTGQETNVTNFKGDIGISGPFDVSENGQYLTFVAKDGSAYSAKIPNGNPVPLKARRSDRSATDPIMIRPLNSFTEKHPGGPAKNLFAPNTRRVMLSPDGNWAAYDFPIRDSYPGTNNWGIRLLSTHHVNTVPQRSADEWFGEKTYQQPLPKKPQPKEENYQTSAQPIKLYEGNYVRGDRPLTDVSQPGNPRYHAFSRLERWHNEQFLAAIFQDNNKDGLFSYIEVYNLNAEDWQLWSTGRLHKDEIASWYKVRLEPLKACSDLVWTPLNNSILVLSAGKVLKIAGEDLRNTVAKSGWGQDPRGIHYDKDTGRALDHGSIIATNNILDAKPEIIAENPSIDSNICPVTESSFLFLDHYHTVCFFSETGEVSKLFKIPEEDRIVYFPNIKRTAFGMAETPAGVFKRTPYLWREIYAGTARKTKLWRADMPQDKANGTNEPETYAHFGVEVRAIKKVFVFTWEDNYPNKEDRIWYSKPGGSNVLEVHDPRQYDYKEATLPLNIPIKSANEIVILKRGDLYVVLKTLAFKKDSTRISDSSIWLSNDQLEIAYKQDATLQQAMLTKKKN